MYYAGNPSNFSAKFAAEKKKSFFFVEKKNLQSIFFYCYWESRGDGRSLWKCISQSHPLLLCDIIVVTEITTTSCSILLLIDKWHLLLDLLLNVLLVQSLMGCTFCGTSQQLLFEMLGIIFASGCCVVNLPQPLSRRTTVHYHLATRIRRQKRILVRNNVPLDVFGADLTRVEQKSASQRNNHYGTQCTSIIH
jgi:hypothetical protein